MKILWITNTIFPAPSKALNLAQPIFGGWMYGLATRISNEKGIKLAVATTINGSDFKMLKIDNIVYYLLPDNNKMFYKKNLEPFWVRICNEFNPDIIHIHGTEFTYGLSCMRACPSFKFVISIQGLVSVISKYYYGGINFSTILKHITFRDIIRLDSIFHAKKNYVKRGILEKEYLKKTHHVIGRTKWDYAHVKALNPNINYHFCNESLRDKFYTSEKWNINKKIDYTIFLSQATYPLKGMHQVLKAVALLKTEYPDIKLRIAGQMILNKERFIDRVKFSGYSSYINSLINKFDLSKQVIFVGKLHEDQMLKEYQNAHIFICPSSIENSPNSIGEAQIVGTPIIASYVGGIPDMVVNGETGLLYQFDEVEVLAILIKTIFSNDELALKLSLNSILVAEERHNIYINTINTFEIYNQIISNK